MRLPNLLAPVLPATTYAWRNDAGCYRSDRDVGFFPQKPLALSIIDRICNPSDMSGSYGKETRYRCYPLYDGVKLEIWIKITIPSIRDPSSQVDYLIDDQWCKEQLKEIVERCEHGGVFWPMVAMVTEAPYLRYVWEIFG
jgi:hypothetical protein